LGVEAVEDDLETFDLPDEEIADFVNGGDKLDETLKECFEKTNAVFEKLEDSKEESATEAAKEKKAYTDEEAYLLYKEGMTLEDLGVHYGIHASTVQRKLKKYEEILAAKEKEATPNE